MTKFRTKKSTAKRKLVLAASLALCLCLTGVTALAVSGKLDGFFKDITRMDGAVIGTSYEQATDEIEVNLNAAADELQLNIKMLYPDEVPYTTFDEFGISSYQIQNKNGEMILADGATELIKADKEIMAFAIPADELPDGEYTLTIASFVGASKADQPLELHGNWECDFTIE